MNIHPRVAVLLPCLNEEDSIARVIQDFQTSLPQATIYVCDNNSTDQTVARARAQGASILSETTQGKGAAVRKLFKNIDADVYILCDGDGTYGLDHVKDHLELVIQHHIDMLVGVRIPQTHTAFPWGHRWGNAFLTWCARYALRYTGPDLLSGYRIFSRNYVLSFPCTQTGFEIETEFAAHAQKIHAHVCHQPIDYKERPFGSQSKLSTCRDGIKILKAIILSGIKIRSLKHTILSCFHRSTIIFIVVATSLISTALSAGPDPASLPTEPDPEETTDNTSTEEDSTQDATTDNTDTDSEETPEPEPDPPPPPQKGPMVQTKVDRDITAEAIIILEPSLTQPYDTQ